METAAKITSGNEDVREKQLLLDSIRDAFGTEVLGSKMNHLNAGTGSPKRGYKFAKGFMYFSGMKVEKNYQRPALYFSEAIQYGNVEAYAYLGKQYEYGWGIPEDKQRAFES